MLCKMINFDEHNPNWPQISDHLCKILVIGSSEPGKTNKLLNFNKSCTR